jgi:hypothetical protein
MTSGASKKTEMWSRLPMVVKSSEWKRQTSVSPHPSPKGREEVFWMTSSP